MTTRSPTILRNKKIVGRNSKSYNDKHPENPISLRPIRAAHKSILRSDSYTHQYIQSLINRSRPEIARGIAEIYDALKVIDGLPQQPLH